MSYRVIRYSEAFKRRIVDELESGELASINEARRRYGIRGGSTIQAWVRKYGKNHRLGKVVKVENKNEKSEIEKLQRRIKELERALVDTEVDSVLDKAYLEIFAEAHGITDMDALKKSLDTKLFDEER